MSRLAKEGIANAIAAALMLERHQEVLDVVDQADGSIEGVKVRYTEGDVELLLYVRYTHKPAIAYRVKVTETE